MTTILRFIAPALLVLVAVGCGGDDVPFAPGNQEPTALLKPGDAIPGQYIVVLSDNITGARVPDVASDMARVHAATLDHLYSKAVRGFSARMSAAQASQLADDPRVKFIEPDRVIGVAPPGKGKPGGGGSTPPPAQQTPWGITAVGGTGTFNNEITVWVIDTGLDLDHPDLNVDVNRSRNFVSRGKGTADDGNGHGTHVGGTIGALNNAYGVVGVAPGVALVAVRVLNNNGSGTYSDVIAGVDYVAANGAPGDVANMSLTGPASAALDNAVIACGAAGIRVALAAGNDGADASNLSPAHVNGLNIYTVSAHDENGCLASWSNFGSSVDGTPIDFAAPGVGILSTWKDGGYNTISGTSMATPHVAGLLVIGALNSQGTACSDPDGIADPLAHQ